MYKIDVINHFGRATDLAQALKITSSSISQWGDIIPERQALRLERITDGSLKYAPSLYREESPELRAAS